MIEIMDNNYGKLYYSLLDYVDYNPVLLLVLSYLIDVFPYLRDFRTINGEVYKRLADSFMQERLNFTSPTIRKYLNQLEEKGLISIYKENYMPNGIRFYKVNVKILEEVA